ncbi:MAG TPA: peptidoglycan-binding domain-containing protein [Thermoleophilaceae bacterium]|nr:peptidoglycan-binding domain-containing protein [Thermoleophilaceae bacterium]
MHSTLRAGVAVAAFALIPAADAAAASYGSRTLREGSTGGDVKRLQRYLDRAGYDTSADGIFGSATARSVRSFETDEDRRANGAATRYEQRLVRARAANPLVDEEAVEAPATEEAYIDENGLAVAPASAPPEVHAIVAAGNEIATTPYKYGGGHGQWRDTGYDCSGSISYALHGAGLLDTALDSTGFMSWGERGRGEWVTTYAHGGHAYMVVAGLRFDTSARKATGNRWSDQMRSASGYTIRHPEGL